MKKIQQLSPGSENNSQQQREHDASDMFVLPSYLFFRTDKM